MENKVTIVNKSQSFFGGWLRTNIDELPPFLQGTTPEANYLVGKSTGLDTWNLDIYCGIGPGERKTIDLSLAQPMDYHPQAGIDPKLVDRMWGGIPITVAGVPLTYLGAKVNGASFDGHWGGKITSMLNVDLWLTWYPDDPAWAIGEIAICASNPGVPDIVAWIPQDMRLVFGDADILVPGLNLSDPLMNYGDWLADGQSRILPIVLCWKRHGGNIDMCRAIANQQIQIRGINKLHKDGNPVLPRNFDAESWAKNILPEVILSLHHWRNSPLDPAFVSGATGAQGAQSFVGGPPMADPLAIGPFYLAALDGSWPMFHLEEDGSQLNWKGHPNLRMFYGRANRRICDDTLGKPTEPTMADSHGYAGPEDEHWFDWTAWAGARLKGTPGTQWILRAHAIHFLFRYVTEMPGAWLTANRGVGWMCFLATELYRGLEDRELAEAVKQRWIALFHQLIVPQLSNGGFWNWTEDVRVGAGPGRPRAVPWQASVCALGLDWAGFTFSVPEAWDLAAEMSVQIIDKSYVKLSDGRWTSKPIIAASDTDVIDYSQLGVGLGYYDWFGMPMAPATALRHNPGHWIAREIWQQMINDQPGYTQMAWLCPGIEL